jgi:hypothetical protein
VGISPQKASRLTLEQIRAGDPTMTQADLIRASQGLLAILRRNAGHVEKGITPGTTSSQRAEARAFWPKKGKP